MNVNSTLGKYSNLFKGLLRKRDQYLWVFGGWFGNKFADNTKFLFLEAAKNKNIRPIWVTRSESVIEEIKSLGYEVYLLDSKEAIELQMSAAYFFVCTGINDVYWPAAGNATIINLWHGCPLKKIAYDDKITKTLFNTKIYLTSIVKKFPLRKQYVIATSKVYKDIYVSCFRKKSEQILIWGQPRNDYFYINSKVSELEQKLKNKKMILYMPTHRNEGKTKISCTELFDMESLNQFCKNNNYIFMIKKHYFHRNEIENIECCDNILDITNTDYDTQELLAQADILITDYSSCYIDYLLLKRPIIFYNYDMNNYLLNDREMYFGYDEVTPGPKVEKYDDLLKNLEMLGNDCDKFIQERERVCDLFYDSSVQCSVGEKIVNKILMSKFTEEID